MQVFHPQCNENITFGTAPKHREEKSLGDKHSTRTPQQRVNERNEKQRGTGGGQVGVGKPAAVGLNWESREY